MVWRKGEGEYTQRGSGGPAKVLKWKTGGRLEVVLALELGLLGRLKIVKDPREARQKDHLYAGLRHRDRGKIVSSKVFQPSLTEGLALMKSQAVSWWPSAYRSVSPASGEASRDIINMIVYPATSERPNGQEGP